MAAKNIPMQTVVQHPAGRAGEKAHVQKYKDVKTMANQKQTSSQNNGSATQLCMTVFLEECTPMFLNLGTFLVRKENFKLWYNSCI